MREINKLIVHHTGGDLGRLDCPELIKMRHVNVRGWDDIGYHYLIGSGLELTENGIVYPGRDIEIQGAHTYRYNTGSIGVAMIGNFNTLSPSKEQMNSLLDLLVKNCKKFSLTSEDVYGHREFNGKKTCPGKLVDMNYIKQEVSKKLSEGEGK